MNNEIKELLDYINDLQEENNQLNNTRYNLDRIELEKRIDKAIEYITTEQLYTKYQLGKSKYRKILKDLLNILNGDDE